MSWRMEMVTGPEAGDITEKTFENFEDGKAWLEQHEPRMLTQPWNSLDGQDFRQFGMNYYYAMFTRSP